MNIIVSPLAGLKDFISRPYPSIVVGRGQVELQPDIAVVER